MPKSLHELSLFIFRRDLRLEDNTGLLRAMSESINVIPLFIITPIQVSNQNTYKSSNAIQFMMESLVDLDKQIRDVNPKCRLWVMYGDELKVIRRIYSKFNAGAIYVNEDYTPYAATRDKSIERLCDKLGIKFHFSTDILLLDSLNIKTGSDTYYRIFTQFYNKTVNTSIRKPNYYVGSNFKPLPTFWTKYNVVKLNKFILQKKYYTINNDIACHGGRENGLKILKLIGKFKNYSNTRNTLSINSTRLSPHNKFGTLSIREVYLAFKTKAKSIDLCKQLYWRDFYYYIGVHFPELYKHRHIMYKSVPVLKWPTNKNHMAAWKEGRTGFPIVDAAMAEINITGFMHNRGRLIVASFLVKDLLIDWRFGEKYFSQKLIDIDRAQNTGNWNWSSSFGLDSTTFLRIFNPWTQSKEYDPDAIYIKKWLPELKEIPIKDLHNWYKVHQKYSHIPYPKPIVDHAIQRKKFIKFYSKYFHH